ncbi:MAG: methylenetetrahydrofolate--tRNA-(uracil(54)-C(5))-methyltransferase (FADH(2)-oxidizing) TrmFO [Clostridia bacterium]|nr:methylenetetrahydrofolate--tRNA-(uracil(54)-C(5))-methyltransferase (FADH(2)-oxidizing) TrmFO [Clostridia bacterium]
MTVKIVGAGLAGCEAAYQLLKRGISVQMYEMRPKKSTGAHKGDGFAELVCSNSLRSARLENGAGLLKEEMRRLDSLIMRCADKAAIPAGGALAVDREDFSRHVKDELCSFEGFCLINDEVTAIPEGRCIIAAGPLCSDGLADAIKELTGQEHLHFYDAAAPIVSLDSLDMSKIFRASRYGRGEDYLNCPMTKEEYDAFVDALLSAETAEVHGFENDAVFEGCMPVEVMASRGRQTLAFGPLKPVGLVDPKTGREPYAVLQLRQDDAANTIYNLVGFQTHLKFGEQKRVFGMIPGLENAEFVRYGVMHRNTFICSPRLLDRNYRMISRPELYFAGQITGVEGYIESAASGMLAGISMAFDVLGRPAPVISDVSAIGALGQYVSSGEGRGFQPMNINFGIIAPLEKRVKGSKADRYRVVAQRSLDYIESIKQELGAV